MTLALRFCLLFLVPGLACATPGAWNASKSGVVLEHRGVVAASAALLPSPNLQAGGKSTISVVYWEYQTTSPQPAGLQVKLCTPQRCVALDGGSGRTRSFSGLPANSEFRFIYYIEGGGRLHRALNVISNSLSVNYK
ncbi:flagellar protein FlhE [Brenneria izbisi]|uniref:Flagellar protein FlhE n=1 Tax=Brenneria izbisi TaxID=2939450 RepID=A0AA41Y6S6_9GAMM|nr:flagellar protein FlhE [Brenneria izbisi]MCV9880396.1 flagellar protein FlhE [Brenneria izbisi]MCV9883776.1 flagellar protein FlhE [Brenneria izbisi]